MYVCMYINNLSKKVVSFLTPDYSQFTLFVFRSRNNICMHCIPQSTVCIYNIKNKIPSSI